MELLITREQLGVDDIANEFTNYIVVAEVKFPEILEFFFIVYAEPPVHDQDLRDRNGRDNSQDFQYFPQLPRILGDTIAFLVLSYTEQEFGFFKIGSTTVKEGEADDSQEIVVLSCVIGIEVSLVQEGLDS